MKTSRRGRPDGFPRGSDTGKWARFTKVAAWAACLGSAPGLARAQEPPVAGRSVIRDLLPEPLRELQLLGLGLWQWLGVTALIVGAFAISWVLTWVGYRATRRLAARTQTPIDDRILDLAVRPSRYLVALAIFSAGIPFLRLPPSVLELVHGLQRGIGIVVLLWLLLRFIDLGGSLVEERFHRRGETEIITLVPLGRKVAKAVLLGMGALAVLQNLGFNVSGILATLGVGGLALALAAKTSVENLIGGATLLADRPVRVGDFCKFGDRTGTVEEIGLRSTRIRSLDRTLISIPNADFAQTTLENFAVRDRMRLFLTLGLRYETGPEQMRHVLAGLRKVLLSHPKIDREPARVRFVGFGAYSLDLEVFAYALTRDWNEFLGIREDIYLRFMDVVKESGTGFAFPSQTTYLGRDGGIDEEQAARAAAEVAAWRDEARLPFPDFSPEAKDRLDDTLDWPPAGSMAGSPRA